MTFAGALSANSFGKIYTSAIKPEGRNFVRPGQKLPFRLDGAANRAITTSSVLITSSFNNIGEPSVMQSYMPASGKICVISNDGTHNVAYSSDHGATWASTTLPATGVWHRLTNDGTYFYALREDTGVDAKVYRSTTGASWTLRSSVTYIDGTFRYRTGLTYANSALYYWQGAAGGGGVLAVSTDGANSWTYSTATTEVDFSTAFAVNSSGLMALYNYNAGGLLTATNINGPWTVTAYPYAPTAPDQLWFDSVIACLNDVFVLGDPGFSMTKDFVSYTNGEFHPSVITSDINFTSNARPIQITNSSSLHIYTGTSYSIGMKMSHDKHIFKYDATSDSAFESIGSNIYAAPIALSETSYGFCYRSRFVTIKLSESSFAPDFDKLIRGYGGVGSGILNRFYYQLDNSDIKYSGHLLDYKASEKYKLCDGVTAYPSSSAHLKRYMPNTTKSLKPFGSTILPLAGAYYSIAFLAYVNSILIAMVVPPGVNDPVIASSVNNGASWTAESTWPNGTYGGIPYTANQNFIGYDGSKYYVPMNNGIYSFPTLSGTRTLTGWTPGTYPNEAPIGIKTVSTSNTYIVTVHTPGSTSNARVYQTVNQGTSWSLVATIADFYPSKFMEQGGTYYMCGQDVLTNKGTIWSSSNMTSWSLLTTLDAPYSYVDLLYNSTTTTWVATSLDNGIHVSTDGMATWTRINSQTYTSEAFGTTWKIVGNVGAYWVDTLGNVGIDPTDPTCFRGTATAVTDPGVTPMMKIAGFAVAGSGEVIFANINPIESSQIFMAPWSVTIDTSLAKVASGYGTYATNGAVFPAYMLIE